MEHDSQLLKGVLTLVILELLARRESYGYQLVTDIRALGLESLAEGTIYPALNRLEREGLVTSRLVASDLGPARKYYTTTKAGRDVLKKRGQAWRELVAAVEPLLGGGGFAAKVRRSDRA
jgi:PadR family transcriptional regulator PadR